MAMASATVLSFNRTTLRPNTPSLSTPIRFPGAHGISLTHFVKQFEGTLNLSSSHSISPSLLQPLALQKSNSAPFNRSRSSPFTVYAAKGYKMKTHKASAKRFRVTGTGKIVRRRAGKQHLLAKKNTKRKLRLSKMIQVDRRDYNNVIGALPYLKVNRKA